MTERDFSVVIPVCHGGRFLEDALRSAAALDYPPDRFEVLVALSPGDASSVDLVGKAAAGESCEIRAVECASPNRASRLNRACSLATGRILAFTDDDCVLPPDWLKELRPFFGGAGPPGAVGGGDDPLGVSAFDEALDWVLNSVAGSGGVRSRREGGAVRFYPKLWNMAVPREVAAAVAFPAEKEGEMKVFDESLSVHEDVELMGRIEKTGRRVHYAPEVRVSHSRDTTFPSLLRRNFDMARVCRREGMHRLPHGVLTAALLAAALLALSGVLWPLPRQILLFLAVCYAVLLAGSAAAAAVAKGSPAVFPWVPAMILGLHLSRGTGYLFPAGIPPAEREGR